MTSKARESRREAARRRDRRGSRSRWVLPAAGVVIVAAAVIAVVLSQGSGTPSPSAVVVPPPTVTGGSLPVFAQTEGDTAVGQTAPTVAGSDYTGKAVSIAPTGRPVMVIFAAHWCPHCQREVPLIQDWIDAGQVPADVDLVSVSTAIDATSANYPPEEWFARVGWTVPLVVDPTNSVAKAFGLTGYPFFVILDGQGRVVTRLSGEIPVDQLGTLLAAVPRS